MSNKIIEAYNVMQAHIAEATKGQRTLEDLIAEFMKLDKKTLATMLAKQQKLQTVSVESVCKLIMEDPACEWLTWNEIAMAVSKALNSDTSAKSIASYASKNSKTKGWVIPARKSTAERQLELMKLTSMQQLDLMASTAKTEKEVK